MVDQLKQSNEQMRPLSDVLHSIHIHEQVAQTLQTHSGQVSVSESDQIDKFSCPIEPNELFNEQIQLRLAALLIR